MCFKCSSEITLPTNAPEDVCSIPKETILALKYELQPKLQAGASLRDAGADLEY